MDGVTISMVAAIGEGRELGNNNQLLWHIPEDFAFFKKLTSGHPILMGRKTYESIGRPLPNRTNIVITRQPNYEAPGCVVVSSLDGALLEAKKHDNDIYIIGGAEIYNLAMDIADTLYLTVVHQTFDADTFFPEYKEVFSSVVSQKEGKDENYTYTFFELTRSNT